MGPLRTLLLRAADSAWLERQCRRQAFARRAVRRFMPGERTEDALAAARELHGHGLGGVLSLLGENVDRREEATEVGRHYLGCLRKLQEAGLGDGQISVKPTHLGLDVDPDLARSQVLDLAEAAGEQGTVVWIDMESSSYVDATLELYEAARSQHANVGVCLQAYLYRTPRDLETVREMDGAVRLVKGAYQEPRDVAYPAKADVDRAFRDLARELAGWRPGPGVPPPALGTHDTELVEELRREVDGGQGGSVPWEVHMLYGVAREDQRRLATDGVTVRVLISYGEQWYPWYVRRVAERPANLLFMARSLTRR